MSDKKFTVLKIWCYGHACEVIQKAKELGYHYHNPGRTDDNDILDGIKSIYLDEYGVITHMTSNGTDGVYFEHHSNPEIKLEVFLGKTNDSHVYYYGKVSDVHMYICCNKISVNEDDDFLLII